MRKSLFACLTLFVTACSNPGASQKNKKAAQQDQPLSADTTVMIDDSPPHQTEMIPDTVRTEGDFNGDGKPDTAFGVLLVAAAPGKTQGDYIVRFSDGSIPSIEAGKGAIRLINEGDLNEDGHDELSIYQAPEHGCTYTMSTWSLHNNMWRKITDSWEVPTGCNYVSDEDLQNRIVLEDGVVYYYQEDAKDSNHFTREKKEMMIRY
jgi:hypothetical protein